ncbi:hypothetical protein BGX27_010355 [Mortierella sp. AM989]|nr:hypothetical protein BGX27_010355 [Mortierella sp. AM989]
MSMISQLLGLRLWLPSNSKFSAIKSIGGRLADIRVGVVALGFTDLVCGKDEEEEEDLLRGGAEEPLGAIWWAGEDGVERLLKGAGEVTLLG